MGMLTAIDPHLSLVRPVSPRTPGGCHVDETFV
jgi:hypothetical protein